MITTRDEMVIVETMPEYLRASHSAACNRGVYPHNGAVRKCVSRDVADDMVASDPDWTEIVDESPILRVCSYDSVARLDGTPSAELVRKSAAAGYTGAVAAYRDADGVWQYVDPSQIDHYRRQLREDVQTVYVECVR